MTVARGARSEKVSLLTGHRPPDLGRSSDVQHLVAIVRSLQLCRRRDEYLMPRALPDPEQWASHRR